MYFIVRNSLTARRILNMVDLRRSLEDRTFIQLNLF